MTATVKGLGGERERERTYNGNSSECVGEEERLVGL